MITIINQTMKSTKLALLSLIIIIVMCATNTFAQKNLFVGQWQLAGIAPESKLSYQKTFDENGNFVVTRTVNSNTAVTHKGKYVIQDEGIYLEMVSPDTDETRAHVAGQTTTIEYKFSEDKKTMTVHGLAVNGNTNWQEEWKK